MILLTNLEQSSGSDPCGIARMVGAMYVPVIMIAAVPPLEDGDPARTKRLRSAIEAFAKGRPDAADYTPAALAVISAAATAQHAAFETLGAMSSFELIADDALAARVVWYRAKFRDATVHFRFALDEGGRMASLQAR